MRARRVASRDLAEPEIVDGLRVVGAVVQRLDGESVPDLLVGFRGTNYLIEVKNPAGVGRGVHNRGAPEGLRPGQQRWHDQWTGQVGVARTLQEALAIIGAVVEGMH